MCQIAFVYCPEGASTFTFFSLDRKETKGQDQTISPHLSPFLQKSKESGLKRFLRFFEKMVFTPKQHYAWSRLTHGFGIMIQIEDYDFRFAAPN
jgi:hypothetical protein